MATVVVTLLSLLVIGQWYQDSAWNWWLLCVMTIVAGCSAAALGLTVGTIFGMILTPVMFLGGPFYPWQLLNEFPVIKLLALTNPLLYISEGFRAAFIPDIPHMPMVYIVLGLTVSTLIFGFLGITGFVKRARQ